MSMRGFGDFGSDFALPPVGAEVTFDETRKSATISFNPKQNDFDYMSRSQGFGDEPAEPEPLEGMLS